MRSAFAIVGAFVAVCAACQGGGTPVAPTFEGCGSDADCKGDRICVERECVSPGGGGSGSGGSSATSVDAGGGTGGSAPGPGADAGGSTPPTGEPVDDPLLEAACIADCESKHAAGCEMQIGGSLDQCMGQCLVIDEYGSGYCRAEQRVHYACLAAGGYTCAAGFPQPKATCIAEATELAACNQKLPCRRFCDVAKGRCAPGGANCFDTCTATKSAFVDLICSYDYDRLLMCWTNDLVCDGARPSVVGCEEPVAEVAECVGRRQTECDGYCTALELLGCGSSACVTSCTTKTEQPMCGYRYESLLRCAYQSNTLQVSCEAGKPVFGVECDSMKQEYDTCVQAL